MTQNTHALCLTVGNKMQDHLSVDHLHLIDIVETTSLKLEVAALGECLDESLGDTDIFVTRVSVEDLLIVVILFNLGFVDKVIELDHFDLNGGGWVVADPSHFNGTLEVFVCLINSSEQLERVTNDFTTCNCSVTPLHEGNSLANLDCLGIILLDEQVLAEHDGLLSEGSLGVQVNGAGLGR